MVTRSVDYKLAFAKSICQWLKTTIISIQSLNPVQFFATPQFLRLLHSRPPCPSPTPGVHPNPCSLSWWCHPIISSSIIPFSSCPQSFPASQSSQMSQFFTSGGQSIGVSASASVLPKNIQDWFTLGWTGFLAVQGTLKSLLQQHSSEASILQCLARISIHNYWKNHSLD